MTTRELLIATRALIERPGSWTKNSVARKPGGSKTTATDPNAVKWCAFGALRKVFSGPDKPTWGEAYIFLCDAAGIDLVAFNDAGVRTHSEVIAVFDRAIERAS